MVHHAKEILKFDSTINTCLITLNIILNHSLSLNISGCLICKNLSIKL